MLNFSNVFKRNHKIIFIAIFCVCTTFWMLPKNFFSVFLKQTSISNLTKLIQRTRDFQTQTAKHKLAFPEIILDRRSIFYGMKRPEMYGWLLNETVSFKNELQDWKDFFPELMSNIKRQKQLNPTADSNLFTHRASVMVTNVLLNVGDEFEATIISRDGRGRKKSIGGDYYRARLLKLGPSYSFNSYPDGIPCRVIDNNNGTYTVKAPLIQQGMFQLDVTLVHTLESIIEIIKQTDGLATWGLQYQAKLQSNETVTCNMNLSSFQE